MKKGYEALLREANAEVTAIDAPAAIASALAGERERCATVITPPNVVSCTCDKCAVRRECAAAIRAGGQEG